MCYILPTKAILINILSKKTEPLNISFLNELRNNLYSKLPNKSFYVDVAEDSVCFVVESNPHLFKWDEEEIKKAEHSDKYFQMSYIAEHINEDIPEEFLMALTSSL